MFSLSPQSVKFDPLWEGLAEGIEKIITLTGVRGMPMIEDVYKLCTAQPHSFAEDLYRKLKEYLENHVDKLRESDMLAVYLKKWKAYSIGTEYVHHIFRYLLFSLYENMGWIRKQLEDSRNKLGAAYNQSGQQQEIYEVFTLALVVWRDRLFYKIKDRLLKNLLDAITKERDGEMTNSSEVRGVIESFVKLGMISKMKPLELYKEEFENPFLQCTREYYARESTAYIAANGVSAYMKKAEQRIEEEAQRAKKYLDSSSHEKLKREVDIVLIDRHREVLQIECEAMIRDERISDLNRMYHLLSRIDDGIRPMLDVLQGYVEAYGIEQLKSLSQDAAKAGDPKTYVETLLSVYQKFSEVVKKAFNNDAAFIASLDKACRKIVNENPVNMGSTKTPELLAKYSDMLLKKGKLSAEEKQLEDKLNNVITIFKYVDDRDVFQKFYAKMLARRLIHGTSVSLDTESFMIGGLKQACGYEYTSKLQRMFTDMSLSTELNEKFKEWLAGRHSPVKLDATILVLTQGSWPLHEQQSNFIVPPEMEECMAEFQTWYNHVHHGRKLHWLHHLSKGDLRMNYLKRKYEVQATSYQMGVLLLFNKAEEIRVEDVKRGTGLKDFDLKRTLQSLVESRIILKKGAEKEKAPQVDESDTLVLNKVFASKRLKLKITGGVTGETPQQHQATMDSIEEDRKLYLQAAIVRIMKARKVLTHAQLVQETIQQSKARFTPNIPMIKKCIEQLIEKDYLARVEHNKYSYVA